MWGFQQMDRWHRQVLRPRQVCLGSRSTGSNTEQNDPQQLPGITRFTLQSSYSRGSGAIANPRPMHCGARTHSQPRPNLSAGLSPHASKFGSSDGSRSVPRPQTEGRVRTDGKTPGELRITARPSLSQQTIHSRNSKYTAASPVMENPGEEKGTFPRPKANISRLDLMPLEV